MTTITIDIESEVASMLSQEAQRQHLSLEQLAKAWLEERLEDVKFENALDLTADELAGIERGLADVAAGRVVSHEAILADLAKWRDE
jgi:predicted transcriptional regulator